MADRAWKLPAAGGKRPEALPDIAAAVVFHPETRQLDLRPGSPADATQLCLITERIVATANSLVSTGRCAPCGAHRAGPPARRRYRALDRAGGLAAASDAPQAPVKTREMASPGFYQTLAAHRAVVPPNRVDPSIAEAVERQTRALSLQAFPNELVRDSG